MGQKSRVRNREADGRGSVGATAKTVAVCRPALLSKHCESCSQCGSPD